MNMPKLVRVFVSQGLFGLALGVVFAMLVVWFNIANLQHLILNVDGGYLAFFLLAAFSGSVFGGVHIAITVMLMQHKSEDEHGREE